MEDFGSKVHQRGGQGVGVGDLNEQTKYAALKRRVGWSLRCSHHNGVAWIRPPYLDPSRPAIYVGLGRQELNFRTCTVVCCFKLLAWHRVWYHQEHKSNVRTLNNLCRAAMTGCFVCVCAYINVNICQMLTHLGARTPTPTTSPLLISHAHSMPSAATTTPGRHPGVCPCAQVPGLAPSIPKRVSEHV